MDVESSAQGGVHSALAETCARHRCVQLMRLANRLATLKTPQAEGNHQRNT